MGKLNIKQEWKKEWITCSFKFLVIMSIILAVIWIGFQFLDVSRFFSVGFISVLRGISLLLYILSLFIYDIHRWKDMKSFDKTQAAYNLTLLSIFFVIYLFVFIGDLNVKIGVFLIGILGILLLTTVVAFSTLMKCKTLPTLILFYLNLALDSIVLFAFFFAVIGGIFPNNSLIYTGGENVTNPWEMTYFSSGNFYTMGYGDISPKGTWMKFATQVEIILAAVVHIIILGYLLMYLNKKEDDQKKELKKKIK